MDGRNKNILVFTVSLVVIITVMFNIYRGITVSKIGIPGLLEMEFNTGNNSSHQPEANNAQESYSETDGAHKVHAEDISSLPLQHNETPQPADNSVELSSPEADERGRAINLTGIWFGEDGSSYEISQTGNVIEFIEYGLMGITASGSGTLSGNQMIIDYQTVFGTIGQANLNLSDNGQIISGTAEDLTTGASSPLKIYRE